MANQIPEYIVDGFTIISNSDTGESTLVMTRGIPEGNTQGDITLKTIPVCSLRVSNAVAKWMCLVMRSNLKVTEQKMGSEIRVSNDMLSRAGVIMDDVVW